MPLAAWHLLRRLSLMGAAFKTIIDMNYVLFGLEVESPLWIMIVWMIDFLLDGILKSPRSCYLKWLTLISLGKKRPKSALDLGFLAALPAYHVYIIINICPWAKWSGSACAATLNGLFRNMLAVPTGPLDLLIYMCRLHDSHWCPVCCCLSVFEAT